MTIYKKNRKIIFISAVIFSIISFFSAIADDIDLTNLGGGMSSEIRGPNAIQVATENISSNERRINQLAGFSIFHGLFDSSLGLGPKFLNNSCGGCHLGNGRGPIKFSTEEDIGTTMVLKISLPGKTSTGEAKNVPGLGSQFLDHIVNKTSSDSVTLTWEYLNKVYPDGTTYELRKPKVRLNTKNTYKDKIVTSLRMTPPIIGPGLLEAITEESILAMSDPTDSNGDGISGKPNYVLNLKENIYSLGRFGFKASHPTVEQQSAAALFFDMGVENSIFFDPKNTKSDQELPNEKLDLITIYQRLGGVPMARNQSDPSVIRGKNLFKQIGCDNCHKMNITTGNIPNEPEVSNQLIHPFTDLLLHDMGSALADKRAEFSAKGSEWRTTPLWGLGFSRDLSKIKLHFLHDGRARTIEEAILWHGGEGYRSKRKFTNLKKDERKDLLNFLRSI